MKTLVKIIGILGLLLLPALGESQTFNHRPSVQQVAVRNKWLGQPATAQNGIPATAGIAVPSKGLVCETVTLMNRGASPAAGMVVGLLGDANWIAGQWTNASTTFTADTADAQSATTNDFALETTTVNDGFIIGANAWFSAVSLDVTTAGSGTTPTHVAEYWNGTAWTAIAAAGFYVDVARSADWGSGEQIILFDPPADWALGGSGTGVSQVHFNLRVRRTNATQATAALARRVYVGRSLGAHEAVASNATVGFTFQSAVHFFPGTGPILAIGGAIATADEGNAVSYGCWHQ